MSWIVVYAYCDRTAISLSISFRYRSINNHHLMTTEVFFKLQSIFFHKGNTLKPKVSIIGSGNVALAATYHLQRNGVGVCLYASPGFDEVLSHIEVAGGIQALASIHGNSLEIPGFERVDHITRNIKEAVDYANVLILPVPAFAQVSLFKLMQPHLRDGQILLLMPGNYGSLALTKILKESQGPQIRFADASTVPWATRIVDRNTIAIYGIKRIVPMGVFPTEETKETLDEIAGIFPTPILPLSNVIEAGLENINFGGHPALTLLNIGILENFNGKFNFYHDCTSPSVALVAEKIDAERMAVGRALGISLRTEVDMLNLLYDTTFSSAAEFNRQSSTHAKIDKSPNSASSRYLTEDVPFLMAPCVELATLVDVQTPLIRACIELAGAMNSTNYIESGRNLMALGLGSDHSTAKLKFTEYFQHTGAPS